MTLIEEHEHGSVYTVAGQSKEITVEYDEKTGRQVVPEFEIEARAISIDGRPIHQEGTLWVTVTEVEHLPNEYADGYIRLITPYEN